MRARSWIAAALLFLPTAAFCHGAGDADLNDQLQAAMYVKALDEKIHEKQRDLSVLRRELRIAHGDEVTRIRARIIALRAELSDLIGERTKACHAGDLAAGAGEGPVHAQSDMLEGKSGPAPGGAAHPPVIRDAGGFTN